MFPVVASFTMFTLFTSVMRVTWDFRGLSTNGPVAPVAQIKLGSVFYIETLRAMHAPRLFGSPRGFAMSGVMRTVLRLSLIHI